MKVSEEFVDAVRATPAGRAIGYFDAELILEAVLPKVRERLLSEESQALAVTAFYTTKKGPPSKPDRRMEQALRAAFDAASPEETP